MKSNQFHIQHPNKNDLERVFQFMLACDIADFGAPDSDLGDLTDQWDEADLTTDAWISLDVNNELNGYALFSISSDTRCDLDTYVNSKTSPQELWAAFFDLAIARGKEAAPNTSLVTYVNGRNTYACETAESCGFLVEKYHYRMQIDFSEPYPAPVWPSQYRLATYTEAAEMELFNLIVSAFDWEGVQPFDHPTWKKQVFRNGRINPDDFILVWYKEKLVAAALCYNEGDLVWLKELAVSKEVQGKGLGSLLLKNVFNKFSREGVSTVALGVVSTNPKAAAFYERNGMTRTREFVQFNRKLA